MAAPSKQTISKALEVVKKYKISVPEIVPFPKPLPIGKYPKLGPPWTWKDATPKPKYLTGNWSSPAGGKTSNIDTTLTMEDLAKAYDKLKQHAPPPYSIKLPKLSKPISLAKLGGTTVKTKRKVWFNERARAKYGYGSLYDIRFEMLKTQKARGLKMMMSSYLPGGVNTDTLGTIYVLPQTGLPPTFKTKMFARPCPVVPRHGFVESRPIASAKEAMDLLKEARKEDPEAEVIVMRQFGGRFSGVATNVGMTWGHGNDGVTSDKGKTALIETPTTTVEMWNSFLRNSVSYTSIFKRDIEQVAYLEIVEDNGNSHIVQCRNGPELPGGQVDYIPKNMTVKKVLRHNEMSLLAWEKIIQGISKADKKGTVVNIPHGALSSHYAVHAIQHGIPVITSQELYGGEKLTRKETKIRQPEKRDLQEIAALMNRWVNQQEIIPTKVGYLTWDNNGDEYVNTRNSSTPASGAICMAIGTLHTQSHWDLSLDRYQRLVSIGPVILYRALAAVCLGEMRHWDCNGPGKYQAKSRVNLNDFVFERRDWEEGGRDYIYRNALQCNDMPRIQNLLEKCVHDFGHPGWGYNKDDGNGAYGGPAWKRVAKIAFDLGYRIEKFIQVPSKVNWKKLILTMNKAVNTAHNNGKALNKWIGGQEFTNIGNCPAIAFTCAVAGKVALGLDQYNTKDN